jgi:amino acid adenylation domain-containing protein
MMDHRTTPSQPNVGVPAVVTDDVFVFPASFAQQRLWFLDQWEPESAAYNVPIAMRLTGPLDLDVFERSLNSIVSRHEILRTIFGMKEGEPVQLVLEFSALTLRILDLTTLPHVEREVEAQKLVNAEAHRPFDLSRGPLVRATALRLDHDEHVVLLTIHHIVFDGWSMSVLFRELGEAYNAFASGAPASLSPPPIQYADYTIWQREWLQGPELERQLAYWKEQLSGPLPVLQLPTDYSRSAVLSSRGAHHPVRLSCGLANKLTAISRQERATLFMALLAAFQTLLSRYTEQEDILVASPIAGRNQVELENLIGFFVNTLVLRTDLKGDPTFRELLRRVRAVTLGAYAHQDLPFEKLVETLRPERSLNHAPLCQAVFVLQNTPRAALDLHGLTAVPFELTHETAKFDVSLSLGEGPDGLSGAFTYSTDLFEASTIARMATHFEILLEGIGADPDRRLSELPLLSARERRQLLVEWNDTTREYPRDDCVPRLFEAQVDRTPSATAVACGREEISFDALNARANQLARYLRSRGVGAEVPVGVCAERSIDMVVALVGILKAGGAYVPLDPNDPPERVGFMLADATVRLVVTEARAAERLPADDRVERFCLDRERETLARENTTNLESGATADNLAYVMYTSGSTGIPKAVTIVHRGIVRLVKEASYVSLSADDVVLQAAPITFDASTFEIWGALLNGARLALAPVEKPSLAELSDTLERHQVTIAWFTSALFSQMVDHELGGLRRVRQVLAGGDVLSLGHVRKFLQASGTSTLINGYGPTENTTFTCCYPMTATTQIGLSVPIGRPISNTQVYVLDAHLNPQPIGAPGELYIGGDGLARGYWNRSELTAAKFIASPFSDEASARLYKTGDRVRYLSDGNLEFLGRVDHQVKIRGFRVELEEIESVLARHAAVREAVVVAPEDAPGFKRLVAYVSVREAVEGSALRRYLGQHLPDYMVPANFVVLDALPKTSAGKVDRRRLPAPNAERDTRHGPSAVPRNQVEERLVDLWCDVLRKDRIDIHDNFFALGGHSLLATQVISRIRAVYGKELPLRALFEAPTVAGLAARLADATPEHAGAPHGGCVVALQPRGTKAAFFCVHGIGGEVQAYAVLAQQLDPDRPFFGLRTPPLRAEDGFLSIEALAAFYVEEVRKTVPAGPYILGGYSSGATVAFEMAQQLTASGEEVAMVVALDAGLPNNRCSARGPRALVEFFRNLFWWVIDDFMQTSRAEMAARFRSKAILLAARLAAIPGFRWLPHRQPDIRDVLGMPSVEEEWGTFLAQHFKSLMAYEPRPYPGRVALFRARALPVSSLHTSDLGWSRMAKGGIEINIVPGSHENILREPYVHGLADALRRSFDEVDKRVGDNPRVV